MAAVWLIAAAACEASPRASVRAAQEPSASPLDAAVTAMFNARYEAAEAIIRLWLKRHPDDVRALNYLAEAVLDREMLRENLYSGAAYLDSGSAFRKREQPVPQGFVAQLSELLNRVQAIEQERLAEDPKDEQALYWLGVTHSTRTEYEFAIQRSYLAALREGKQAWKINKRLLKMDPDFADAYLVIGLADYTAGALPWYFKLIASIGGIHGNRAQGVEELQRASSQGHYARVDAEIVLVAIYEREKQYPQALALLRQLENEYPLNYLAPLEIARVDQAEDDWRGAAAVYDRAVERFVRADPIRSNAPRALILLRAGQAHEHLGDLGAASDLYHEAGKMPGQSPEVYQADLAAARLDRYFNRISEARREYQHVADAVPDSELAKEARRALQDLP